MYTPITSFFTKPQSARSASPDVHANHVLLHEAAVGTLSLTGCTRQSRPSSRSRSRHAQPHRMYTPITSFFTKPKSARSASPDVHANHVLLHEAEVGTLSLTGCTRQSRPSSRS